MEQMVKDKLCKLIDMEVDKISAMQNLTDGALANLYRLIEVKKGILKIEMLEDELYGPEMGYSYRNQYSNRGYSRMANSYEQGRRGNSNRHMPNEITYDGYSMDGDVYAHLEEAMHMAKTQQEREAIRQAMSKMQ